MLKCRLLSEMKAYGEVGQNMKIFIINLERAIERKVHMQRQFENLDPQRFQVEFFKAIDCLQDEHLAFGQYSKFKSLLYRGKELSDGERACFASHYSLWQKCVELGEPIVILEDDVELFPQFGEGVARAKQSEYVYIRLSYLFKKGKMFPLPNNFSLSFSDIRGTQGYYLTPRGALAFIESARSWYCPVDDYMDMFFLHRVPNVCIEPVLKEVGVESTIRGRGAKVSFCLKLSRECARIYFKLRKWIFAHFCKKNLLLSRDSLAYLNCDLSKQV